MHEDGLSSDDEESNSDILKFSNDKSTACPFTLYQSGQLLLTVPHVSPHVTGLIVKEADALFEDVSEEFAAAQPVLDRFMQWKSGYTTDYSDAFVGLCLPKLLSPLIKLSLISWDPFEVSRCSHYIHSFLSSIPTPATFSLPLSP